MYLNWRHNASIISLIYPVWIEDQSWKGGKPAEGKRLVLHVKYGLHRIKLSKWTLNKVWNF